MLSPRTLSVARFTICQLGTIALFSPAQASLSAQQLEDTVLSGVVVSIDGEPIEGALVEVLPPTIRSTLSDDAGEFSVKLAEGQYRLRVSKDVFAPSEQTVRVGGTAAEPVRIVLRQMLILSEIDVAASYGIDRSEPISTGALTAAEVLRQPRLGNDLLRGIRSIPGVSANDAGAQFNVRGGLVRDSSILLDGLEIYEPYHLKDFVGGIFSIVDPDIIGSLDLIPGGFPAEYGDKMAGVLDLTVAEPRVLSGSIGMTLSSVWASASDSAGAEDSTRWRFSARRGFLDLISSEGDEEGEQSIGDGPQYWDLFGKVDHQLSPSSRFELSFLTSGDSHDQTQIEFDDYGDLETDVIDSSYGNSYLWLTHQGLLGDSTIVETLVSGGLVDRDRAASVAGFGYETMIHDVREVTVLTLRQDWNKQVTDRHLLKWGFEGRRYDVAYDYRNDYAAGGVLGEGRLTRYRDEFRSESYAVYVADRLRLTPKIVLEVGGRYDHQTHTDEDQVSPRFNLRYDLGRFGVLRAAAGRYYQSQRPHELQVEDGETSFLEAERAEALLLGWERNFGGYNFRVDAYRRQVNNPRPFFTNIFEVTEPNPESTRDRILVDPDANLAQGVEFFLSRRSGHRLDWWATYTFAEVTDEIDGRDVPRFFDQTSAFSLSGTLQIGRGWSATALFNYHTGWPTTSVSGRSVVGPDGELVVELDLGEYNGERLPDYHRFDMRLAKSFSLRRDRSIEFFLDVQNAYGRDNVSGYLVDDRNFEILQSGAVSYTPLEQNWLGVVPSFGINFRF
jgi:hypothetical protein